MSPSCQSESLNWNTNVWKTDICNTTKSNKKHIILAEGCKQRARNGCFWLINGAGLLALESSIWNAWDMNNSVILDCGLVSLGLDAPSGASLFLSVNLNSAKEISIRFYMQGRKQRLSSFRVDAHAGWAVSPVVCVSAPRRMCVICTHLLARWFVWAAIVVI